MFLLLDYMELLSIGQEIYTFILFLTSFSSTFTRIMSGPTWTIHLNGITYSLDTTDYIATVASITYDNATCAYSPNTKVFSINIPESISYNNHSYTVKYFGEGKNKSVFEDGNTSIKTNLSNLGAEKLVVILKAFFI